MKVVDQDGNGTLEFPELLARILKKRRKSDPVLQVFDEIDTNKDGFIRTTELWSALGLTGERFTRSEAAEEIR